MNFIVICVVCLYLLGCAGVTTSHQCTAGSDHAHEETRGVRNQHSGKDMRGFSLLQIKDKSMVEKAAAQAADIDELVAAKFERPPSDILRPAGQNITAVEFGMLIKNFYGMNMPAETWTADVVIITRWMDARIVKLIPEGQDELRLNLHAASDHIWLPDITVTNVAQRQTEVISSSYLLSRNRTVTGVERAMLTMKSNFACDNFPFDKQNLQIRIASATYMSNEVTLIPTTDASLWGADKGLSSSFPILNTSLSFILERDGLLEKSRGVLSVFVQRSVSQYVSTVFLPSNMLLGMTWTSLWLPLGAAFTMPRVGLNAIALLAQVNLAQKVESFSPGGRVTWLDSYMEMCFSLQFGLLFMNGFVMMIHNRDSGNKKPHYALLAEKVNTELSIVFPFVWFSAMLCVWFTSIVMCRVAVVLFAAGYLGRVQCVRGEVQNAMNEPG